MNAFLKDLKVLHDLLKEKNEKLITLENEYDEEKKKQTYIDALIIKLKEELEEVLGEKKQYKRFEKMKKDSKRRNVATIICGTIVGLITGLVAMPYSIVLMLLDCLGMYYILNKENRMLNANNKGLYESDILRKISALKSEIERLENKKYPLDYDLEVLKYKIEKMKDDINDLLYNNEIFEENYQEALITCKNNKEMEDDNLNSKSLDERIDDYYHENFAVMYDKLKLTPKSLKLSQEDK